MIPRPCGEASPVKPAYSRGLASTAAQWNVVLPDNLGLRAEVVHQMSPRRSDPLVRTGLA